MSYDRISPFDATPSFSPQLATGDSRHRRRCTRFLLFTLTFNLLLASAVAVPRSSSAHRAFRKLSDQSLSLAITDSCATARYPALCITSLQKFSGKVSAGQRDIVHISLNMTLHRVGAALYGASALATTPMDPRVRAAYDDCIELLDDSVDQLSQSLLAVSGGGHAREDVVTWLSAALTNHDTCSEGLDDIPYGYVKQQMAGHLKDLSELVSNCLAIFSSSSLSQDFAGVPIEHRRKRRLLSAGDTFPYWLKPKDRKLLQMPAPTMQADFIVSQDGNGTHKTINDAVKAAPEGSLRRIIIYVKAGRYDENIKVSRKKINLMFVGDGKGKTIVAGSRSIYDNYTTFHTATFGM